MNKEEHILYWTNQVENDFDCSLVLYQSGHYAQSLFWAHLALEKLCKAVWVKNNENNTPPLIHNLLRIVTLTNEKFTDEQLVFLADMNMFQIKGKYPDYAESLELTINKDVCELYLEKSKQMIICLQEKLQ
jgi:HEPN domain-containing protein